MLPGGDDVRSHWTIKADAWTKWADAMARQAEGFNRPLLDAIALEPGQTVLDLASGAGEPAISAAQSVAPDGLVVASDIVPEMLSGIKRRDRERRLKITAADMQSLPFADETFDRVSCRFGIMFVPDPEKALLEVRRVLKPGGMAGFLVWGPRKDQTMFQVLGAAVEDVLDQPPDTHHMQIFRFGSPGTLGSLFHDCGFEDVCERELRFTPLAPLDKPFWRPQLAMSFSHMLHDADEDTIAAIEDVIQRRLAAVKTDEGYRLNAHIRLATGCKAA